MLKRIKSIVSNSFKRDYKSLVMCKKCYSFYYKKVWHFEAPASVQTEDEVEVAVRFAQCPACLEQEMAIYENDPDLVSYGV